MRRIEPDTEPGSGSSGRSGEPGESFGPYRLIKPIGHGGMGTVYLAVRDDEFRRRVAIKVLRLGMDSASILARFRQERQILAALQHPYIASLLDGGTTPQGQPYFAMEFVEGEPVTDYCQRHALDVKARLRLFVKICAAVQYAHQNLVVHRDIKPANVLVAADGTPKLLDFGIAKLLNPELGGQTLSPTVDVVMLTPQYASPEQLRGEVVTAASDIYSLGVLLYQLLTHQLPYPVTSSSPAEIARIVCESVPIRPSTATGPFSGTSMGPYGADSFRLNRELRGDLDNIVLKALAKEVDRRYSSVDHFSDDIQRHLDGMPVAARKDTIGYRVSKFVRRNRATVAFGVVTLVALIAAVVVTARQARVAAQQRQRAEQRFEEVRHLANSVIYELHDAIRDLPGATPARQLLVTRALEYLDRLAKEATERADLRRDIAGAYIRVGDLQGKPLSPNIGDTTGAKASYEKAIALYETLSPGGATDPAMRRDVGTAYLRMSALLASIGRTNEALPLADKALALYAGVPELRRDLVVALSSVGDLRSAAGDTQKALEHRRAALAIMRELTDREPADATNLRQLAVAYHKLGNQLGNPNYPNIGDHQGALENLEQSEAVLRKGAELYPSNAVFARNLGVVHSNLSDVLLALKRTDEALTQQRLANTAFRSLSDVDPADTAAKNDLAISTFKLAQMLEESGKLDEAVARYETALSLHEQLSASDAQNDRFKAELASDLSGLAHATAKQGRAAAAIARHERAVALSREVSAADPGNAEKRFAVAAALVERAESLALLRQPAQASRDYREAIAIMERFEHDGMLEGTDITTLAEARAALAKLTS